MTGPIVFIGDSITEAWGFLRAETFEAHDLVCRGGSGQTARWITMRFRRDLEETGAAGVHLLCGVNDIGRNEGFFVPADAIADTLFSMLDEARAMGVRAWVGSIMPAASIPWNPEVRDAPAMIAAVNARLRDEASAHGATFVDYHAVLAAEGGGLRDEYGTDGLHLSPAGYAAIEPLMLAALGRVPPRAAPSRDFPSRDLPSYEAPAVEPAPRRVGLWILLAVLAAAAAGAIGFGLLR